jgi:hypothetical protein
MSPTPTRTTVAALAVAGVVLGSALGGCSISRDDDPEPSRSATSSEPSTSPTEDATESTATPSAAASPTATESTTTSPSAEPAPSETSSPTAALLDAAQMPRLNRSAAWTVRRTGVAPARTFGLCQKFDLLSIGAMSAYERVFAFREDSAAQQVAEFPDVQNAARAVKVLEAWHRDCAKRVRGSAVNVRPRSDVPVTNGTAWTYLVSFERGDQGRFHSLGVVRSGSRLSVVRIDHGGQDHNYGPGKEPTELAVKAASAKLG